MMFLYGVLGLLYHYSTNKWNSASQAIKGVIILCLLSKGGQNSTPEAQEGGSFPLDICVHFNVLSAPLPRERSPPWQYLATHK